VCEVPADAAGPRLAPQLALAGAQREVGAGAGAVLTRDLLLEAAPKEQR
jgi:hypothetical protein